MDILPLPLPFFSCVSSSRFCGPPLSTYYVPALCGLSLPPLPSQFLYPPALGSPEPTAGAQTSPFHPRTWVSSPEEQRPGAVALPTAWRWLIGRTTPHWG